MMIWKDPIKELPIIEEGKYSVSVQAILKDCDDGMLFTENLLYSKTKGFLGIVFSNHDCDFHEIYEDIIAWCYGKEVVEDYVRCK